MDASASYPLHYEFIMKKKNNISLHMLYLFDYRELEHPNVLKLLGQCLEATPYLLILELCPFVSTILYVF